MTKEEFDDYIYSLSHEELSNIIGYLLEVDLTKRLAKVMFENRTPDSCEKGTP